MCNKVNKSTRILGGIGLVIAALGLIAIIPTMIDVKEFVTIAFATIISAFAGTSFAFRIQNNREDKINREKDIKAAHSIEISLLMQHRKLKEIKERYLDEYKDDPFAYIQLKIPSERKIDRCLLDTSTLSIFTHTKYRENIKVIMIHEDVFRESVERFNSRSKFVIENVLPIFDKEIPAPHTWSEERFTELFGVNIHSTLKAETENIYNHFDDITPNYLKLRINVFEALTDLYPDHIFLNPEDDPE